MNLALGILWLGIALGIAFGWLHPTVQGVGVAAFAAMSLGAVANHRLDRLEKRVERSNG